MFQKKETNNRKLQTASLIQTCGEIIEKSSNSETVTIDNFFIFDSRVHQPLSIKHEIYEAFNDNPSPQIRGILLDISEI